jgi:hypothetical protein
MTASTCGTLFPDDSVPISGAPASGAELGPFAAPSLYFACAAYQDKALRKLPCKRVQMDEIWSFVYAKNDNVSKAKAAPATAGDVWTWTAISADTKLIVSWLLGARDMDAALAFS